MTPDELNALMTYLSGSGSSDLNAFENLFGLPSNLLAQAALGVPGVDANYISQFVQENAYEDYKGEDPVVLQENTNAVLVRLSESLGVAPETMNALVSMVDGGTPADVAVSLLLPDAYSSGFVDDGTQAMLKALQTTLEAHAVAADLSESVITDPISGDMYTLRPDDEVRDIMESAGLKGQFADPDLWTPVLPEDRLERSNEAALQAQADRDRIAAIGRLSGLGSEMYRAQQYDPTESLFQFIEDSSARNRDLEPYRQPAPGSVARTMPDVGSDYLRSFANLPDTAPRSAEADGVNVAESQALRRDQMDAALKAAQRYATFAAVEQQQKNQQANEGRIRDIESAVPLPYGGVQTRQDSLDAVALSNAIQAREEATIPGADAVDAFRNFVTESFPGTSGGGTAKPPKIRLTPDQISRTVNSLTSPLRGRI